MPVSGANQFWPKNLKGRFSDPGHRSSLISMVLSAAGGNHQHQQHHHCHQHYHHPRHQPGQRSPLISLALAARIALISPPIKTGWLSFIEFPVIKETNCGLAHIFVDVQFMERILLMKACRECWTKRILSGWVWIWKKIYMIWPESHGIWHVSVSRDLSSRYQSSKRMAIIGKVVIKSSPVWKQLMEVVLSLVLGQTPPTGLIMLHIHQFSLPMEMFFSLMLFQITLKRPMLR